MLYLEALKFGFSFLEETVIGSKDPGLFSPTLEGMLLTFISLKILNFWKTGRGDRKFLLFLILLQRALITNGFPALGYLHLL